MNTHTEQLNALLPEQLRPGSSKAMNTEVERLMDGGWTVPALRTAVIRNMGTAAGPGVVIYQLRNLPDTPPPAHQPTPTPRHLAHSPCPDNHGDGCEMCYCDPDRGPIHHRTSTNRIDMVRLAALIGATPHGTINYTPPPDSETNHLRCACPDPEHTMALVATGNPIAPDGCPLHTVWAEHQGGALPHNEPAPW